MGVNDVVVALSGVAGVGVTMGMGVATGGGTTVFEFEDEANPAPFPFNCQAGMPAGRTPKEETRVGAAGGSVVVVEAISELVAEVGRGETEGADGEGRADVE